MTLSDKISRGWLPVIGVKAFIKELKADLCKEILERPDVHWASLDRIPQRDIMETIDKLAGEKLT